MQTSHIQVSDLQISSREIKRTIEINEMKRVKGDASVSCFMICGRVDL